MTAVERPRTIARLWRDAVARSPEQAPYLVEDDSGWHEVSWPEAARTVDELAHGLLALGIEKGDAFAILGPPRLEWSLFDFALALVGAVGVGIYADCGPTDVAYVLEHSEAVGLLAADETQLAKVEGVRPAHVLTFADLPALRERGRGQARQHPEALDSATGSIAEDDLFTLIYTSGTTGRPKACMITNRNYYAMVETIDRLDNFIGQGDMMLLYLPLAHNFGRLMHLAAPYAGYSIAFVPDPARIVGALPVVRPTVLPSVPRLYEKVHASVTAEIAAQTGLKRRLADWALAVGRRASERRLRGDPLSPVLVLQHRIAALLVARKVHANLGGRIRFGISGGAPLAQEVAEFFHALDLTILEGYGLTECTTAATLNRPGHLRFGTVGTAMPGFEVRIADDGEVLIRSETVFAGYFKDPEATRGSLTEDGWLRSGDVGTLDEDGFLRITDRKKDLIVTAGGKNVAPQNLEAALKSSKYVSQAIALGDRRPYIVALLTLDPDEVASSGRDPDELAREAVDAANGDLARFEQVKRFAVLPRDFSAEEGEVTPTQKLRRKVIEEHFAAEIAALYER